MGGLFSTPETPPERYRGKWFHEKTANMGVHGKVKTSTTLTIKPNGTVRNEKTVETCIDEDTIVSRSDTGDVQVTGWKDTTNEDGTTDHHHMIYGGFFVGISKRLEITPMGKMHVLTDDEAESTCGGNRVTGDLQTYTYTKQLD